MPHNKITVDIRPETPGDIPAIAMVNTHAFGQDNEARLVEKIRAGAHYLPDLSLVSVQNGDVVGHLMFSTVLIQCDDGRSCETLALAPVAVEPAYQRCGIGSVLVRAGLKRARESGWESATVLGHPAYYPKFGFRRASLWNIRPPFSVPDEAFMAIELREHALRGKAGVVVYPEEFQGV